MDPAEWYPMTAPAEWARGVDPHVPAAARIYDYLLGGSHNFDADRKAAEEVITAMPAVRTIARANRDFLGRAVRYLIDRGVRQFLDIGSGIPTVGNVHEIAQNAAPDARVVYVDTDPVAVTHGRQILAGNDRATAAMGDVLRTDKLLRLPEVRATLDLSQPVGLLMVSLLHFLPDTADPHGAVARLRDAVAPGSYLVISHAIVEAFSAGQLEALADVYRQTTTPGGGERTRDEVARFFTGFELVDPGLVWLPQWRPTAPDQVDDHPERYALIAGVGLKPER